MDNPKELYVATGSIHLLLIDPQVDFCDIPEAEQPIDPSSPGRRIAPALPVPGADADMKRLAAFIDRRAAGIEAIHITLDSHHPVDIAHPSWWVNAAGACPAPFTAISVADVAGGAWRAADPTRQAHSLAYVEALAAGGRHALVIWPEHCLIGHPGHNVHPAVAAAVNRWSRSRLRTVDYVIKGRNPGTEHYSAIRAEVIDPRDDETEVNEGLLASLRTADEIVVGGEALSHCVAHTVRDVVAGLGEASARRITLLEDCSSNVPGFDAMGVAFVAEMVTRGMNVTTGAAA